ncbi:hypothetical protein [Capnocytophaga sp.]|uniref:hypothetical protein n=1 Tax=Capnocytophaga sp. TaxID=44737 RepID=UPI0026DCE452|nr:hypothetical protein [Capnocytophaga sp.]MDO5106535.1 hypothetical protein [Capnocytophaga sp.]
MHNNIIPNIVLDFCKVYLNPRNKIDNFNYKPWVFNKNYEYFSQNEDFYDRVKIDWGLCFKLNNKILSPSEIKEIVFNELNGDIDDDIYNIILSMLVIFYLPYNGFYDKNNFIHRKFTSFIQLSFSSNDVKINNLYRDIYIKNIFYNSFFVDGLKFLKFKNGTLYFKGNALRELFSSLTNKKSTFVSQNTIEYCLLLIDFLENGTPNNSIINGIDDIFLQNCHYSFFDKKNRKSNFYKKAVILLDRMYSYPSTNIGDLSNKMFALNFIIFNKEYQFYIDKYMNKNNLDKINNDIAYLKKNYLSNRHIANLF